MDHPGRQQRLRSEVQARGLSAMFVTHLPNIRYITGFTGSSATLIVPAKGTPTLFTDGRYTAQAKQEVKGAEVRITSTGPLRAAAEYLAKRSKWLVGFEAQKVSVTDF